MKVKHRSSGSRLLRLAVAVFAVYAAVTILQLQVDVQKQREELAQLEEKCRVQHIENKELELQISNGNEADYIERTAREKLDFVYPYEKVFINASGS